MNEFFQTIQKLTDSTEQLLQGSYNSLDSLEIQESAKQLNISLKLCEQSLKIHATQFKPFIEAGLRDLDRAEDVWNSKQNVLNSSTITIWENLGELMGYQAKIETLFVQGKQDSLEKNHELFSGFLQEIKREFFFDSKNQKYKTEIGWNEKNNFNKSIKSRLFNLSRQLLQVIEYNLELFSKIVSSICEERLIAFVSVLPQLESLNLYEKINGVIPRIKEYFEEPNFLISSKNIEHIIILGFSHELLKQWKLRSEPKIPKFDLKKQILARVIPIPFRFFLVEDPVLNYWKTKMSTISWKEVDNFIVSLENTTENQIKMLFDDRAIVINNALKILIDFYYDLLEKQSRYREEKPEQRLAEKAWIDRQRKGLLEIQARLDEIID